LDFNESIRIGFLEITQHKLRSALTMLGVIFGVAAVISTSAIGAGAREELERQLSELGANTIRISAAKLRGQEEAEARRQAPWGLTRADAASLSSVIPGITAAAPLKRVEVTVAASGRVIQGDVVGTDDTLLNIVQYKIDDGRFLAPLDDVESRLVCVIGDAVRLAAFPLTDPIGQTLSIDGRPFTVVGTLAPRSRLESGAVVESLEVDRTIFIPISTSIRRIGAVDLRADRLTEIILRSNDAAMLRENASLAERMLLRRHNRVADFRVVVPEELIRQQQKTKNILSQVLMFIATISLLVGGIGIMNIMLASVTQRTREIGIRRALGATRRDILSQFMIETLIVSLVGGFLGIGMGFGLAKGISNFAGWTTIIPAAAVILSVSVSAAIGFLFGAYPSWKASRLDPIEALRSE